MANQNRLNRNNNRCKGKRWETKNVTGFNAIFRSLLSRFRSQLLSFHFNPELLFFLSSYFSSFLFLSLSFSFFFFLPISLSFSFFLFLFLFLSSYFSSFLSEWKEGYFLWHFNNPRLIIISNYSLIETQLLWRVCSQKRSEHLPLCEFSPFFLSFFWSFYPFILSLLIFCQSDLKKMQIMMMVNAYFFPLFLNLLTLIFGQVMNSIQETTTNAAVKQGTEKPTFFVFSSKICHDCH